MKKLNTTIKDILKNTTKSVRKIKVSHQVLIDKILSNNKLIITEDGLGRNNHNNN